MLQSPLKLKMIESPLQEQLTLQPKEQKGKKHIVAELALTSLVDAFAVLVIYLIFNAANGSETLNMGKDMKLPFATKSVMLTPAPVLKIEKGNYFLNDQPVRFEQLPQVLAKFKKTEEGSKANELIVQADQETNFEYLNPILLSASESGFHKFKFAVIQDEAAR